MSPTCIFNTRVPRYSAFLLAHVEQSPSSTTSSLSRFWITRYGSEISRYVDVTFIERFVDEKFSLSQILEKDPLQPNGPPQTSLVEIGPRFVLTPIRIFEGAFSGATVFANPGQSFFHTSFANSPALRDLHTEFVSPAVVRSAARREKGSKYRIRKDTETQRFERREDRRRDEDELAVRKVFA